MLNSSKDELLFGVKVISKALGVNFDKKWVLSVVLAFVRTGSWFIRIY